MSSLLRTAIPSAECWESGHNGFSGYWVSPCQTFVVWPDEDKTFTLTDGEGFVMKGTMSECFRMVNSILNSECEECGGTY